MKCPYCQMKYSASEGHSCLEGRTAYLDEKVRSLPLGDANGDAEEDFVVCLNCNRKVPYDDIVFIDISPDEGDLIAICKDCWDNCKEDIDTAYRAEYEKVIAGEWNTVSEELFTKIWDYFTKFEDGETI